MKPQIFFTISIILIALTNNISYSQDHSKKPIPVKDGGQTADNKYSLGSPFILLPFIDMLPFRFQHRAVRILILTRLFYQVQEVFA